MSYYRHGETGSRLYKIWVSMLQRCYNPIDASYSRYGRRGISVAPEWQDYMMFRDWALANGYEKQLTLDRRDNNGNYTPQNCRWRTHKQQQNNRDNNVLLTIFDETKTVAEWTEDPRCAVRPQTVYTRLFRGWTPLDAVTTEAKIKR